MATPARATTAPRVCIELFFILVKKITSGLPEKMNSKIAFGANHNTILLRKIADLHDGGSHLFAQALIFVGTIGLELQKLIFTSDKLFALYRYLQLPLLHKDVFVNINLVGLPRKNSARINLNIVRFK